MGPAETASGLLLQAQRLADRARQEAEADGARSRQELAGLLRQRDEAAGELDSPGTGSTRPVPTPSAR